MPQTDDGRTDERTTDEFRFRELGWHSQAELKMTKSLVSGQTPQHRALQGELSTWPMMSTCDLPCYSMRLLEKRDTSVVSVWSVGLIGGLRYEALVLKPWKRGNITTVTGWLSGWGGRPRFAIDMAGFAVQLKLLLRIVMFKTDVHVLVKPCMLETALLAAFHLILAHLAPKQIIVQKWWLGVQEQQRQT